ncbi:hypothetical protein O3M35_007376 [Rhynocoris fuscipes]|uniref:Pericentrin/AKAP-450 centrosomal targeting domain-containing protein n=1 Tax=Rhynocoris fuscipes TaxID=488301 RepID=A0AAW1D983_9HEMI
MNIGMIDEILADKNEDIEHLQHTVTLLQSQVDNKQDPDKSHSRQSKGLHVSFAKDVSNTSFFSEDMKIRAAPFERSLELLPSNDLKEKHSSFCSDSSSEDILPSQVSIPEILISSVVEPEERSMNELNLKAEIDRLKLELTEKAEKILLLENKLSDLQNMEEDLQLTKSQLEAVLSSVSEDKLYYEEKLLTMSSNLTKREEEVEYLNNLISEKDVEIMKTSADVKALQQILANLQEKLKEAQSLVETETITEIKKEIIDLREENIRLKSDINEKRTLENTIKSLENEKKHLENSLEISENDKASLKTNVKLLENEKKNLEHLLELSEKDKVSFEVNVSLLENEKKKLENSLSLSEKDKASLEANVKLLENEKKKLENSLKLSEKDKASLEANVKLFENEKKKLEYSLEMLEKDKVSLEVNVKLLENVKKKLENSLEVLDKDKASLEANAMLLENEKKLLENKVADLESKKNFLETCIKSMEDDKVLLRSAIENIKENKDSINADLVESKKLLENEKQKYFNLKEDVILLTSENKKATEQLSNLMDQNNNLKKEAKDYENKLSEYMSFVKDVKQEIIKQNRRKININETPIELDQSDDLTIVKTELNKLIALFGQIDFERKRNIEELQAMKNGNKNDMYSKEIEIKKLQNEITQLQSGILQIKNENKDKILSLEKEIRNLEEDVKNFQQLELEAKERLKKEILDKQKLSMKLEEMITNFNDLNTRQDDKKSNSSTAKPPIRLTISTPSYFEFLPETSGQEIDDLTEKLRMEAHLSAHLDKYIINNLVQESGLEEPHSQEGNCNCKNYQSTLIKKVSTLESMLRKEMDVGKELKSRLASGEKQLHELTSLKSKLENELSKNERLLKLRDKQVGEMSSQLKDMKTKIVQMEFCTSKEKILMKQLEKQFEEEKQKFLNSRKEDLLHLEDMRKRLEMFRESEGKLKKLLMEKQARCEELEAELNSYKALEKYDKDLESGRNVLSEQLDEQKTKIWQLTQHLETEQRIRKDLENVLMRERNALTALNNLLKEETRHKALLEKEISTLKRENAEIFNQRDAVENRFVSLLRSGTSSHERLLEKNRNAIESAHLVISVLEQECAGLKERIKHYEESDGTDVNFDLIRQINQFSSNIESLMKERSEFIKAIQELKTERSVLHEEIESLKKAASANKNCQNSSMLSYPNIQLTAPKNVHCFPFRDEDSYIKFQTFVSISLRNESKKKSLVWQKKYLSIALRGYENLAKNTLAICGPKRRRTRGKKVTFRHLSMAVIAVVRMRMLIKLRYDKRNEVLNDIIQTMSFSSFHNQGANQIVENPVRVKSPKSSLQVQVPVLQHSPPSRDGPHRTFHSPSAESSSYNAQVEILRQRMKHIAQANKKN